ncbi:MAG TPA: hypothetical protein VJO13_04155 [Ktedonobacterales bacterium]|nr:hypothetical protein [Ktedonobacterales bacterium]
MNNGPEAQSIGWNLGIVSGLFAALQVLISASAARANIATIESMRWSLARLESGGGNPMPLLGLLVPVALITYGAMIVTGAVCLVLCWYAGRLTAYVNGRRGGGAGAGFRVALLSGLIWIAFSIIISLLLHADGTITGVVASTHDGSALPAQLAGLLIQQLILGAIGLGLGAWAGAIGSNSAPLPETPATAAPAYVLPAAYGMYPAYPPMTGHPTNGSYPVNPSPYQAPAPYAPPQQLQQPTGATPPSYPPPPDYYRMPSADQTPSALQPPVSSAPQDAPTPDGPANQPPAE